MSARSKRAGLPIASQAGKGLFRRQEVQDLVALARVLADGGDTLAFGALMRGPLVGLSEEELLDITAGLPPLADRPDAIPRFSLATDPDHVSSSTSRGGSSRSSRICAAGRGRPHRRCCLPKPSSGWRCGRS